MSLACHSQTTKSESEARRFGVNYCDAVIDKKKLKIKKNYQRGAYTVRYASDTVSVTLNNNNNNIGADEAEQTPSLDEYKAIFGARITLARRLVAGNKNPGPVTARHRHRLPGGLALVDAVPGAAATDGRLQRSELLALDADNRIANELPHPALDRRRVDGVVVGMMAVMRMMLTLAGRSSFDDLELGTVGRFLMLPLEFFVLEMREQILTYVFEWTVEGVRAPPAV